uniref:Uncharacterized protein n=1 Tax=Micrurus lemniscatus lemniscatus TaxID=129467 RepID=A0A2D4HSL6_MICLE
MKVPRWLSTMEAMIHPNRLDIRKMVNHSELLDNQGKLKSNQELKQKGIIIDWWPYLQIQNRYKKDLDEFGFDKGQNQLDKILIGPEQKFISKAYKYLLDFKMEEEMVKSAMIAWVQNFGYNIDLEEWEKLWSVNYKSTTSSSYKENLYKMFLAPTRLVKIYPNTSPK